MAIAAVQVGEDEVWGRQFKRTYDLTFSGNFPDEGEAYTALGTFKLRTVREIIPHGAAVAADGETGLVIAVDYVNSKFIFLESAATGLALLEKTNAEVYPTGLIVRVTVTGNPT